MDGAEANVLTQRQPVYNFTDTDEATVTRRVIKPAQVIHLSPIPQVLLMIGCLFPGLVLPEPNNAIFVKQCLWLKNGLHEIDTDKLFIVVVANISKVCRKIPRLMGF